MVFIDGNREASSSVHFLGNYQPYWKDKSRRIKNPKWDQYSGFILDLKESKAAALLYFFRRVDPLLHPNIVICTVPSSNPANVNTGIRVLGMRVALNNRTDGTGCLVRTKAVPKAATGGTRSVQLHMESIEVCDPEKIANAEVLLLDDVTTSGVSLTACKQLLLAAGAKSVKCLALAQTVH